MTRVAHVDADLCFRVEMPDREPVVGQLTGQGNDLTLEVSDPEVFAGSADAEPVRRFAGELAQLGLRVRVRDAEGSDLIALGAVRSPWWQRAVTRSPHMRVSGWRGLVAGGRGRLRGRPGTLPGGGLVPPSTPYPLAPTFLRRPVRRVSTTHDPGRGGGPRLVELPAPGVLRSDHPVHWLQEERTTIGSDPACDIVLPDLAPLHATLVHDEDDEYVIEASGPGVRVHGRLVERSLLRTAARIEIGGRVLTFVREEYADHGRPHGGRIGGELGRQQPQPPRPDRTGSGAAADGPGTDW